MTNLSSLVRPSPPATLRPLTLLPIPYSLLSDAASASAIASSSAPAPPFEGQSAVHQGQGKRREKAGHVGKRTIDPLPVITVQLCFGIIVIDHCASGKGGLGWVGLGMVAETSPGEGTSASTHTQVRARGGAEGYQRGARGIPVRFHRQ